MNQEIEKKIVNFLSILKPVKNVKVSFRIDSSLLSEMHSQLVENLIKLPELDLEIVI